MAQQLATGRVVGSFFQHGQTHLGGAQNVLTNPSIDVQPHPAHRYFDMFGVPPKVDPNNLDNLGHESHTIASLYEGAEPTKIKNYVIADTLQNEEFQHFVVCPAIDASTNMEGVGTHVLRFGTSPLSPQPEGSSGTLIKHRFERTKVKLERWGQAFELHDDFAQTPEGAELYQQYLTMLNHDMAFSGMMAVMSALLHCYDPTREFVARYGRSAGAAHQSLDTMNRMFGSAHKRRMAFHHLQNHANQVARAQSANGQFSHVFVTEKTATQFLFGDPSEYIYSEHGPGNRKGIDGGTAAFTRMQNGTIVVKERDYNLDGTTDQPGTRVQLLEQRVSTGRYNALLLDNTILTTSAPDPRSDMSLGYLDMDTGDGQIKVQDMSDLVRAMICWGPDGSLNRRAYEHLVSGKNAEILAQRLGLGSDGLRTRNGVLIDPFVVDEVGKNRAIVQIVGNMHTAYFGPEAQSTIARIAAEVVRKHMTDDDMRAMNVAIKFAEDAKNAAPDSAYSVGFASASIFGPVPAAVGNAAPGPPPRIPFNVHGVTDIPDVVKLRAALVASRAVAGQNAGAIIAAATPLINRGLFPGFSTIKHLRTVRDFVSVKEDDWYEILTPENQKLLADVAVGVGALEKFARVCKLIWSVPAAQNVFFRASALPFWLRTTTTKEDEIDAFLQNIVFGLGYPTGLVVAANNNAIPDAFALPQDHLPLRFVVPAGLADPEEKQIVRPIIDAFFAALGLNAADYGNEAARRAALDALYKDNAFGDSATKVFTNDFLGAAQNAAAVGAAPGATADSFAQSHLERLFAGLRVENSPPGTAAAATRGLAAVTSILISRVSPVSDDQQGRLNLLDARVRAFAAVLAKFEKERDDDVPRGANGDIAVDDKALRQAAWLGSMAARGAAGKRKLVRTAEEALVEDARQAARANQGNYPDVRAEPAIRNTNLSFSAVRWREVYAAAAPADNATKYLVATDPANPVNAWMARVDGRLGGNPQANEYHALAAREKYHIDDTCMGKISGAAFDDPAPKENAAKRMRTRDENFGGRVSGARYINLPPRPDAFGGMSVAMANELRDDAMDVDGDTHNFFNARRPAPHRIAAGSAVAQDANKFLQWRWERSIENYSADPVLLAQHLLLLGARVHRDSFVNMIENGVPPPVGIVTVDPFIGFSMTHAVFAVAGCGYLYYGFPRLATSYNAVNKILHAFLTVWLKASIHLPQNVYIAENISFNSYLGGGNGSLVRNIYSEDDDMPPEEGYDYYPSEPKSRRANRFVLHVGVNTKLCNLPNPLPLCGTFDGPGAYHGVGRFVNPEASGSDQQGLLYDSALLVNLIAQFDRLNNGTSVNQLSAAETFVARGDMVAGSYNTLCYLSDQWMRNRATGAHDVHTITGTGPLAELCPGVMKIMCGDVPGLIEDQLKVWCK